MVLDTSSERLQDAITTKHLILAKEMHYVNTSGGVDKDIHHSGFIHKIAVKWENRLYLILFKESVAYGSKEL